MQIFHCVVIFVYYAPGVIRIAGKSSAPVKNRAHTIETRLELKGGEQGVLVAVGGMTLFVEDNRVYDDYLDGVHYILTSAPLAKGTTDVKFNFIKTQEFGGKGQLYINVAPFGLCSPCRE
jgi:hypothetical protein